MSKELGPMKLGDMRITLDDIQKGMLLWKFHVDKEIGPKVEQKEESTEAKDPTTAIDEPTSVLEAPAEDTKVTFKATVKDAATTTTSTEAADTKSGPGRAPSADSSGTGTGELTPQPKTDEEPPKLPHAKPFIKIMLRKTEEILLYEQRSETVPRDSDEGRAVLADNELYEELTQGAGSNNRRTRNSVTQTRQILRKCREVNTETIRQQQQASYVSNFEMFDTYRELEQTTQSMDLNRGDGSAAQKFEVTTYKVDGVDTFVAINRSDAFHLALMMALRILAGNVYEQQQRRFRNMLMPDPLALQVQYKYRLELLWRFASQNVPDDEESASELADDDEEDEDGGPAAYAVADMSWCVTHGDILAVAYGSYSYGEVGRRRPQRGHVCVWSIKNPVNPERSYRFDAPVVSVEFCPTMPQLLAVGLYDGSVQIADITRIQKACAAVSQRSQSTRLCFEPITALAWLDKNAAVDDPDKMQALLALSQDGSVTKFRIITSPYLLAYPLVALQRCDGHIEGISKMALSDDPTAGPPSRPQVKANNNVQGLDLCLHPLCSDIYHVLSDEGCIYRCSTNYPQQHLAVFQAHEAGINVMAYSPWSPKLFLTCGNDWCIRVWLEGIFEPIMTLQNGIGPVHWAAWSETHSTVLVSVSRHTVDVWDFRRSTLKPMSSTTFDKVCNTTAKFSLCGRSLAVGKEDGSIMMVAFEDMPFPPYFQYDQLEKAIHEAAATKGPLLRKVRSLGFLGYAGKQKRPRCPDSPPAVTSRAKTPSAKR